MLYGGLDVETVKIGKSRCRNAAIAESFHYMHIIEAWGTGIPRLYNRCAEYGLPEPLIIKKVTGYGLGRYQFIEVFSKSVSEDLSISEESIQQTKNV